MDLKDQYLEVLKKSLLSWTDIGTSYWIPKRKGFPGFVNRNLTRFGFKKYLWCSSKMITLESNTPNRLAEFIKLFEHAGFDVTIRRTIDQLNFIIQKEISKIYWMD